MGNKSEMLVTVRAPEGRDGRVRITLTTDLATEAVMHWGVRRGRAQEWLLPPQVIRGCGTANPALEFTPSCMQTGRRCLRAVRAPWGTGILPIRHPLASALHGLPCHK